MTPNIMKSTQQFGKPLSSDDSPAMDGDHSAKTMEQGANSAMKGGQDMTEGIHESAKQTPGAGEKTTGHGTSMFSKDGAIGKHFNADGAIGGRAESIGGPFESTGVIGKQFTPVGSIGGTAQALADKNERH